VAVDGLGNEEPTLLLSNNEPQTAGNLIIRYAGPNRVEDGLGSLVDFFHLDSLCSEVRPNADLDALATVLAHGCYRWLGSQLKGYEKVRPKQLYRKFVETGGLIELRGERDRGHIGQAQPQPAAPRGGPGSAAAACALAPPALRPLQLRRKGVQCEVFSPRGNRR